MNQELDRLSLGVRFDSANRYRWSIVLYRRCLYAAIDLGSMVVLDIELFSRRGTDSAAFTRAKASLANESEGFVSQSEREAF